MKRAKKRPEDRERVINWDPPKDLPEARRLVPEFPERWEPVGQFIWNGTREIGTMQTPALARVVCACHNSFIWLLNRVLWLGKRLQDVEGIGHE